MKTAITAIVHPDDVGELLPGLVDGAYAPQTVQVITSKHCVRGEVLLVHPPHAFECFIEDREVIEEIFHRLLNRGSL